MKAQEITSLQNAKIKYLKKLASKKYRRQDQMFCVENLTIIYDALKSGHDFQELFVTQDFIARNQEKFDFLQKKSEVGQYYLIDESLNKHYSSLDTPSGITAVYQVAPSSLDEGRSVLYLNGIKDPGNMGTMMRSALAFGVENIVLDSTCVDIYNAKVINAAKDAVFKLHIIDDRDGSWLKACKGRLPIYAASSNQGISLPKFESAENFCLVLGSESHGISEQVAALSDQYVRIDINGDMESLNVSAAAAILLYGLT